MEAPPGGLVFAFVWHRRVAVYEGDAKKVYGIGDKKQVLATSTVLRN